MGAIPSPTNMELIETGEKRDMLGRKLTPRERREELLTAYRESGLTQSAFAKREKIKYTTFCSWAQRERATGRLPLANLGRPKPETQPTVHFVEVGLPAVAATPAELNVRLPDGTELRGKSVKELAALARALRR